MFIPVNQTTSAVAPLVRSSLSQLFLERDKPKPAIGKHAEPSDSINVKPYRQRVSQLLFVLRGNPVLVRAQGCSYHGSLGDTLLWLNMPEALPHRETNPPVCQTLGFLGRCTICSVEVLLMGECHHRKRCLRIRQNWIPVGKGHVRVCSTCSFNGSTFLKQYYVFMVHFLSPIHPVQEHESDAFLQ